MTNLAESPITLIPCSPLKKWPFLPPPAISYTGRIEPFLFLIAAPRNSSCLQNLSSSGKSQPVPSFCPLLFPTYPLSSGGLHRSHNFKFISAPELPLNSALILPLAYLTVPCSFLIDMSSSKPKSWFPHLYLHPNLHCHCFYLILVNGITIQLDARANTQESAFIIFFLS